ncbi:MAG: GldG family protein [Eubacteriales bacterium]|nr:GldG family protein [Eubacteriales bacterium]
MKKEKKLRSRKNLKAGTYSLVITAAFLAVIVLVNVGVTALGDKFNLQVDMTQSRRYSLSTQTEQILKNMENDVTIYTLYSVGAEDSNITQVLSMYRALTPHIKVESIDIDKNPQAVKAFTENNTTTLATTSLVVSNGDQSRYRILTATDQYEYSYDTDGSVKMSQLVVESALTSAINYVESGYMPNAYFLQGHGEKSLDEMATVTNDLKTENYNVMTLDITTEPDKMAQGDILVIAAPKQDLSEAEREYLKAYMDKGGRFLFVMDPVTLSDSQLPNFESLLKIYGLELERGVVMEGNLNYMANSSEAYLVPDLQTHDITDSIVTSRIPVVQIDGGSIKLPELTASGVTITSLLTTSDKAWLETDFTNAAATQDEDEKTGKMTLAVSVEKDNFGDEKDNTKVLLYYGTSLLDVDEVASQISTAVGYSNMNLLNNSLAWLKDSEKDIYIRGKSLTQPSLVFSSFAQILIVLILTCLLVPVVLFIVGIVVYLRRKNL